MFSIIADSALSSVNNRFVILKIYDNNFGLFQHSKTFNNEC